MNWKDITFSKFKRLEEINSRNILDDDKLLFSTCIIYGISENTLDNMNPKEAAKKILKVSKLLTSVPKIEAKRFVYPYKINYNTLSLTFGQYIEIAYFLQGGILNNAHLIVSSCAKSLQNIPHSKKADCFLHKPIEYVLGAAMQITNNFNDFNKGYKGLFGAVKINDKGNEEPIKEEPFIKQYGWIFSATQVAEHEKITLDAAFNLPIVQALNDLSYLKSKGKYLEKQIKSVSNGR
jgi:hypothetical protein